MAFKLMTLRCDSVCVAWGARAPTATQAWWDQKGIKVVCIRCRPIDCDPAALSLIELDSLPPGEASSAAPQSAGLASPLTSAT